ncbi:MAG: polysaccharide pyruvyl transferase family protein [Sulfuricurvum sp.]|nr:polysaccharide pyruvyl transferase family protein [Sulfuricurvum sp.]
MKKITIFDTSIASENIGDFIIMDSVNRELKELFKNDMLFYSLTHDKVSRATYRLNKISDYSFIGGTNLLSSNMNSYNQWKINLIDSLFFKNIILMGVGWWQYQKKPNFYTKYLLKKVLNKNILHSVRDSHTEMMLKSIGINNVINTGCMTMWKLNREHCTNIPKSKSNNVVFTLTDYNKDVLNDQKLINILIQNYKRIYFWPQGSGDLEYIKTLKNINNIEIIGGNLFSYDELLDDASIDLDFIGTRLHAGIRALQKSRRTIILGIDNRAEEKSKDFNLKVLARKDIDKLEEMLKDDFLIEININEENINQWKKQFS